MKVTLLILFFCINLIYAKKSNDINDNKNVKEVSNKISLESLITSGKWNVEYVKYGNKAKAIANGEWMHFLADGKSDIAVSDVDFGEKWFFNKSNNTLMIKVFTEYTAHTKYYEFKIKKTNNNNIIISTLLDGKKVEIGLKK